MPINKVKYGKRVLLDLTADTVTAETLLKGQTAHDKAGRIISGTLELNGIVVPSKPAAGDNTVLAVKKIAKVLSNTYLSTDLKLVADKAGTYRISCIGINTNPSATDAKKITSMQFYLNGKAVGIEKKVDAMKAESLVLDVECNVGDYVEVYAREAHGNSQFPFYVADYSASIQWPDIDVFMHLEEPDPHAIPDWVQPDASNPYNKGDKVKHKGSIWVSTIDRNIWEPGVYGWTAIG